MVTELNERCVDVWDHVGLKHACHQGITIDQIDMPWHDNVKELDWNEVRMPGICCDWDHRQGSRMLLEVLQNARD